MNSPHEAVIFTKPGIASRAESFLRKLMYLSPKEAIPVLEGEIGSLERRIVMLQETVNKKKELLKSYKDSLPK